MLDYLVDFYSADGAVFRCAKFAALDDGDAQSLAAKLGKACRPASYKITRIEILGNTVIHGPKPSAPVKAARKTRAHRAPQSA